jgi:hypothetical protein
MDFGTALDNLISLIASSPPDRLMLMAHEGPVATLNPLNAPTAVINFGSDKGVYSVPKGREVEIAALMHSKYNKGITISSHIDVSMILKMAEILRVGEA